MISKFTILLKCFCVNSMWFYLCIFENISVSIYQSTSLPVYLSRSLSFLLLSLVSFFSSLCYLPIVCHLYSLFPFVLPHAALEAAFPSRSTCRPSLPPLLHTHLLWPILRESRLAAHLIRNHNLACRTSMLCMKLFSYTPKSMQGVNKSKKYNKRGRIRETTTKTPEAEDKITATRRSQHTPPHEKRHK